MLPVPSPHIQFPPGLIKDLAHLCHACLGVLRCDEGVAPLILQPGEFAHFLADLHAAELRPAHAAEMRGFGALCRQRLVVILLRRVGVER